MKVSLVLGLGLLLQLTQLAAVALGSIVNRELAMSHAGGVTFLASNANPVPGSLLMALRGNSEYEKLQYKCSTRKGKPKESDKPTVLIVLSKCLKDDEIQTIKSWIKSPPGSEMESSDVDLEIAVVPGDCSDESTHHDNNYGAAAPPSQIKLLSSEVLASDLARFSSAFGAATRALGQDGRPVSVAAPVALISFVDNPLSFGLVDQYVHKEQIDMSELFGVCDSNPSFCEHDGKSVRLSAIQDIFLYDPYTITRKIHCAKSLPGGIPVSYVDEKGERDCFCSCPAGFQITTGEYGKTKCTEVDNNVCPCVWSDHTPGYEIKITGEDQAKGDEGQCRITNLAKAWGVPVPFPQDNYVADSRVNQGDPDSPRSPPVAPPFPEEITLPSDNSVDPVDPLETGPHIGVTTTFADGTRVESSLYTWKDYQEHRQAKIDLMEFSSYGKYSLTLVAKDYSDDATCEGCVAIVDQYRPQNSTLCPANYTGDAASEGSEYEVPEMTTDTLNQAQDLLDKFYEFGDLATNDACSTKNRCDVKVLETQDFFEHEACDKEFETGKDFFELSTTIHAFVAKAKAQPNPLVKPGTTTEADNCENPVKDGVCTRCITLSTTLKEKWTNYTCGAAAEEEIEQCDGSHSCDFKQCLVLHGETFASVTADIKADVKATSQAILDQLPGKEFLQTETQIHRSVQCSNLHDSNTTLECSFSSKVTDLIDTTADATFNLGAYAQIDDFVFWRYRVGNGDWKLWNADAGNETFVNAKTDIHLEAWTQCGKVHSFCFSVHLHPHSDVLVCEFFPKMWYQTSVSRLPIEADICTYPKSDFAELTFDYHPNIGLMYARDKLRMNVSKVVCDLAFDGHSPAEILSMEQDSPEIVTRFAVEALNNAKTDAFTKFNVACHFTYKQFGGHEVKKECRKPFSVKDCTPPEIDNPKPPVGECEFDDCAGKLPGPYEACAGILVQAAPADSSLVGQTYVQSGEKECCSSCKDEELTCTAILDLPDTEDNIKRCEPLLPNAYGNPYDSYNSNPYQSHDTYESHNGYESQSSSTLMSVGHAIITASQEHVGVTTLLGMSALVALVALAVVKRHRRATAKADETLDDVYYPLLH